MSWKEKRRKLATKQVQMVKDIMLRNNKTMTTDFWGVYNCRINIERYLRQGTALKPGILDKLIEHTDIKLSEYRKLKELSDKLEKPLYEAYRKDTYMGTGTLEQIADKLGVKPNTVMFYRSISSRNTSTYVERVL